MTKETKQTFLRCPQCGEITSIWRRVGRQKKAGHIKDLYCYKCQKVTKQIEIKEYEIERKDGSPHA